MHHWTQAFRSRKSTPVLLPLIIAALLIFSIGLSWGLPSEKAEPFLFGNHPHWTGKEILALAPQWSEDSTRGADVAAHPLGERDRAIVVNSDDAERAAIVRRFRLYSAQPDEMITLRALAQMNPRRLRFDPRLYQYGGLWVYPVGALLQIASIFDLVTVTSDLTFYLDHPEAFGRLYVVMRLYSIAWGLLGVVVMFILARRISQSRIIGTVAAICYMLLPAVINGAHEAKPHLAGAVLGLIALDCASRAIAKNRMRWVVSAGLASGAAAGMVLSGAMTLAMLPVMALFLKERRLRALAISVGCAVGLYGISNPYVLIHLVGDHSVLWSNIGNSTAMYQKAASIGGALHAARLFYDSGSMVVCFGISAVIVGLCKRSKTATLVLAGALPGLLIFAARATGKPGEYGRFALPMDVMLVFATAVGLRVFRRPLERGVAGIALSLMILPSGVSYVWHYGRETFDQSTRLIAADRLKEMWAAGARTLAIDAEPAPYNLPPIDLFKWHLVLLPRGAAMPADADVRLDAVDVAGASEANVRYWTRPRLMDTPLSWAAKPFRIETRPPH